MYVELLDNLGENRDIVEFLLKALNTAGRVPLGEQEAVWG